MADDPKHANVVFIDAETTGLDICRHELWEIALIDQAGAEHVWHVQPQRLDLADSAALRVNRFWERRRDLDWQDPVFVAGEIVDLTAGTTVAGACPWFDVGFLEPWLRCHVGPPAWSHRLLCVENMAAGALGLDVPVSLSATAGLLDVPVDQETRHTALGDARLTRAVYQACLARRRRENGTQAAGNEPQPDPAASRGAPKAAYRSVAGMEGGLE